MDHDLEARKQLGRAVRTRRRANDLANTAEWATKVGRSDRMLLGLERGEAVGADTYAAVAKALDLPLSSLYDVLDGRATDLVVPQVVAPSTLTDVSDEDLAREVLRRMKGEAGGNTATTNPPDSGPGEVIKLRGPHDEALDALPDEADEVPPIRGRSTGQAARRKGKQ